MYPTQWVGDLEVKVYPRKGRPSSFCFLDTRAPKGYVSKSLNKGETLEVRVAPNWPRLIRKRKEPSSFPTWTLTRTMPVQRSLSELIRRSPLDRYRSHRSTCSVEHLPV